MDDVRQLALSVLDTHGPRLLRLLARLTLRPDVAEELFQDLFTYLVQSPKWSRVENPVGYTFGIAINLACSWRRTQRRINTSVLEPDQVAQDQTPLEGLVHREELELTLEALAELPETMRKCVILRYFDNETPETIGRQFNKSAHQVRSICSKGLAKLRDRLIDQPEKASRIKGKSRMNVTSRTAGEIQ